MKKEIDKDILDLINICARRVGDAAAESFSIDMWNECQELGMQSPIEQRFYVAINQIARINIISHGDTQCDRNGIEQPFGLFIMPQKTIDKFRVDFYIAYFQSIRTRDEKKIIVECDGHEFHEKTKEQARHDKQRDRFLQSKGYKIFHYTGSEIFNNALGCAKEVLSELTGDHDLLDGTEQE